MNKFVLDNEIKVSIEPFDVICYKNINNLSFTIKSKLKLNLGGKILEKKISNTVLISDKEMQSLILLFEEPNR